MDTITAIKTRRSIRSWIEQPIPDDILNQILEAGRWAPSPLNSQPWHFTLLRNKETIKMLAPDAQHGAFLPHAQLLIIVTVDRDYPQDTWLKEHEQHIYSGVCAIQNMWLAAWELSIGACWITIDDKASRNLLGIPSSQVILGSLALGYIRGNPLPHREIDRKPLSDLIFYEKYGATEKTASNSA